MTFQVEKQTLNGLPTSFIAENAAALLRGTPLSAGGRLALCHHFLAGRRYFSIGYDPVKKLYFVETAAFERSSVCEYSVIDSTGVLRENIVVLWENLILNFERLTDVTLIDFSSKPGNYNEPYQLSPDIGNLVSGSVACPGI